MKINYTNQLQRNIMQDENFHCMPDNEQPKQEQSILSIEDRAKEYAEKVNGVFGNNLYPNCEGTLNEVTIREFSDGAKSMLPIIKELGEALRMVKNTANKTWDSIQGKDFAVGVMLGNIKTTLDKYKQLL